MTFQNPLGFYSLEFPPEIEAEIMDGDFDAIADTISEIALLQVDSEGFVFCTVFSYAVEDAIKALSNSQQITLIRWLAERLEFLAKTNAKS